MTDGSLIASWSHDKGFAYLRVSGKGQVDADGFVRQLNAIKEYADAHDIKIVKVFREEGISGTKELSDRPPSRRCIPMGPG